jgi:hypothetical protein
MRYRLRTLLIVLAIGPPAIGFAVLLGSSNPVKAILLVAWSMAFVVSLITERPSRTGVGLTVTEWLVVLAIAALAVDLLGPYWQSSRHSNYGYGT